MTRNLDDFRLAQACLTGRTEAYGDLVAGCQDRLYPVVLRLMGSPEDAQDLLQDAFVLGFEKLNQFQGDSSFFTWMYRISVNLAMSRLRKHSGRRVFQLPELYGKGELEPVDESETSAPSHALDRAEREAIIASALNDLDPDHRAVVVLKDYEGRRYEEIGNLLGVPVGTVRSRLHRARRLLRERLGPLLGEGATDRRMTNDAERALS